MHHLCPECGSHKFAHDLSEQFCGKCGFVTDDGAFTGN